AMLQDYDTSIKELARTIEKDQALVPKILSLVNSAFFGFSARISAISHAVIVLGFNTVRNAVVSVSIIEALSKGDLKNFDITRFWTHSIAVAVVSRYLAEKNRQGSPEDYFTAGLVHDIGKIVLAQYFQDLFKVVWASARENSLSFYEAEKKEISITHAHIGGYLAGKWKLPHGMIDAIRHHHTPNRNVNDFNLLITVHVADIIVNSLMGDAKGRVNYSAIHPDAAKALMPHITSASKWFPDMEAEIESACAFFVKKEN
ncbi:MAG: HDOD domain-containing protein, partial [Deltaproteobacteria bacterium]|nr:HDOD domain-containing protein [Deltaproteobacteria bacterium]